MNNGRFRQNLHTAEKTVSFRAMLFEESKTACQTLRCLSPSSMWNPSTQNSPNQLNVLLVSNALPQADQAGQYRLGWES